MSEDKNLLPCTRKAIEEALIRKMEILFEKCYFCNKPGLLVAFLLTEKGEKKYTCAECLFKKKKPAEEPIK